MVWETIQGGAKKAVNLNSWPSPVNWITDMKILVCNQDIWIAQWELAFALAANFFWTNILPSPRELERKYATGGYRCGFYLNNKIKSPIEIIWGQGTARMIGEIASPFARGLFYFWASGAIIDAFALWQTMMFPQALCDPFKGDGLLRDARASIPPGHFEGVPGLGEKQFDVFNLCAPTQPSLVVPPGVFRCYAAWIFNAGPSGMANCITGWQIDGLEQDLENHGDLAPGAQKFVTRERAWNDPAGHQIAAWCEADGGPAVIGGAVICVRFIWDYDPNQGRDDYPSNLFAFPQVPIPSNCYPEGEPPA